MVYTPPLFKFYLLGKMLKIKCSIIIFIVFNSYSCTVNNMNSVRYGIDLHDVNLNPTKEGGFEENLIKRQIFETLLILDKYGEVKSHLVKNWEELEENKKYRFYLEKGISFHDGSKFTAYSVKYSIQQYIKHNNRSLLSNLIEKIQIEDSLIFSITLKRPYAPFLFSLTSPFYILITSEKSFDINDSIHIPIGTGPYMFNKNYKGDHIQLTLFKNYWNKKYSNVDKLYFIFGTTRDFLEENLKIGNLDILYLIRGNQIDRLKWQGKINYYVQDPISTVFIGFNNKNKPFHDITFRRALSQNLNYRKIVINLNRGNAILSKSPIPPIFGISHQFKHSNLNMNISKDFSAANGLNKPFLIRFFYPKPALSRRTLVEALKVEFEKFNLGLQVTEYDTWSEHDMAIKSDSSQMFLDSYSAEILGDPSNFFYSMFHSRSDKNTLHYENPTVDSLIDNSVLEHDARKRKNMYIKAVKLITNDIPAIFMFHVKPHYAYRTEKIKKLVVDPYGIIQFHKTELN